MSELMMENIKIESEKLTATLAGSGLHLLADKLVDCFDSSGAINYLDITFEHEDTKELYSVTMSKLSGISQGEKIAILNAELNQAKKERDDLANEVNNALQSNDYYGGILNPIVERLCKLLDRIKG